MHQHSSHTLCAWRLLYYTYTLVLIVVGIDKFLNYIVDWNIYLNPAIPLTFGLTPYVFLRIMGIIEIGGGLLVFYWPRGAGYIVAALLLAIVANLVSLGFYDIALRDVGLAVGAIVLSLLSPVRDNEHGT